MRTLNQVYADLRKKNRRNYFMLYFCSFLSVLLITSFSIVMQSNTVQSILPEGGDTRTMMTMIFVMAIFGCAVFTIYSSSLFFRSKSREMGIYMALGASKARLRRLLFLDLALASSLSAAAGLLLGTPLAIGLWQLFRLIVPNSSDMAFSMNMSGYLWPLGFILFTTLALFIMGIRFMRRSNILDVVNEQRKTESVKPMKRWQGLLGIGLMIGGGAGGIMLPNLFSNAGIVPPAWINLFYVLIPVGLYMLLLYVVVQGFGGRKRFYRNIITRSMMKFQGRSTVLNMCAITVLVMATLFALFYSPMQVIPAMIGYAERPIDYAFHHRLEETGVPGQTQIEQLAAEEGVQMHGYKEVELAHLAVDGYDRSFDDGDAHYRDDYFERYEEGTFISQSAFLEASGIDAAVQPGHYAIVLKKDYTASIFDFYTEMTLFTNPDTMETLPVKFQRPIEFDMMHMTIVLTDADYAAITTGLTDAWRETWVHFNVDDVANTYGFALRLRDAIIDGSSEASAIDKYYIKFERGEYQSKLCPYGYQKGADGRMEPDPETAPIVRQIFAWAADGMSAAAITRELYAQGVPTPGEYKASRGVAAHDVSRTNGIWPSSTVLRMLEDERYIGTYVIGKRAVTEIGGHRVRTKDKSEWHRIPDHHPAIVDKAVFDRVQAISHRFSLPNKKKRDHPLRGKVYCGLCGHALSRQNNAVYYCRHSQVDPASPCRSLKIRAGELEDMVYEIVSKQLNAVLGMDASEASGKMNVQLAHKSRCEEQIAQVNDDKEKLYAQLVYGEISREAYKARSAEYDAELVRIKNTHAAVSAQAKKTQAEYEEKVRRQAAAQEVSGETGLTQALADALIDRVVVYPENRVEISYKFDDFSA